MRNFLTRLKHLIDKEANGKHTVFARRAGIPPSTFQAYLKGRAPHVEHLIRIHETFSVSIDWLLTGTGRAYIPHPADTTYTVSDETPELRPSLQAPLLRDVIQGVERIVIRNRNLDLSPEKKAEAISLLYDLFAESGKKVSPKAIERCLKLITT